MFEAFIIILGLIVFEVISSIDNAIVNAHVLKTMSEKFRKIFLVWGLFIAVFVVRGILPFLIIWIANPGLSSIRAVIYPKETDYWYYLHDPEGRAHYARSLEEHNQNSATYLR